LKTSCSNLANTLFLRVPRATFGGHYDRANKNQNIIGRIHEGTDEYKATSKDHSPDDPGKL
jgi:hypothetical protein